MGWFGRITFLMQMTFGFSVLLPILSSAPALLVILIDALLPVSPQSGTAADNADSFAHHLIVQRRAFAVAPVVHSAVGIDAEISSGFYGVDICAQKQEFPAVFFFSCSIMRFT